VIRYPKRLIEVDLPIRRISEFARMEKNIRSGHPWQLHIWWARRPWGACRSVALASLLPAPTDEQCSDSFVQAAAAILSEIGFKAADFSREKVEEALLRFVGEFARWEAGADPWWREIARKLIHAAHPDTPHVFDPFSGYGAIPGEAARLGCESIASDLNPVALLCLRTLLEAVPRHGYRLIEKFQEGANFVRAQAERRLAAYYPRRNGKHVIAWLWARTVMCEGPGCGASVPLISQTTIAKGGRKTWIEITGDTSTKEVHIAVRSGKTIPTGLKKTAGGGHAVCPVCGFTTNKERVKMQGKEGRIGHRLYGVAMAVGTRQGKEYGEPTNEDHLAFERAAKGWEVLVDQSPEAEIKEPFVLTYGLHVPPHYGIKTWGDLFSPRQKLALYTISEILRDYEKKLIASGEDVVFVRDTVTALALAVSNYVPYSNNLAYWGQDHMNYCYKGMGISMKWDWAEANPLVPEYTGGLDYNLTQAATALASPIHLNSTNTTVMRANAVDYPLPDDSANMFFTDPPYYDVVPYADLSDLCYVWLKRFIGNVQPDLLSEELTPKADQIVVNPYAAKDGRGEQSPERYRERMTEAFREGRRVLRPDGIGCVVFAHKGTAAWETLLGAILDAGFVVTASWPIDTEKASRQRANKSAALGSSVHIVIRPRENVNLSLDNHEVGDWREVLAELPIRIHEWMPRLGREDVVGADAIFACLGPALQIYSQYQRVEKANGEQVFLGEFLEHVWAAISREALAMIFQGADATGFEEDARLTAMWLWTLKTGEGNGSSPEEAESDESAEGTTSRTMPLTGFNLEYDAARKIAQGLGAHLENLSHLVAIQGETAVLLPVVARSHYLFGKDSNDAPKTKAKKKSQQMAFDFVGDLRQIEKETGDWAGELKGKPGQTVLDQVHQSMILFAAGRTEALKRFMVEEGIGRNPLFWRLSQALSALYPSNTDEKRWVDGVLARKKGLGF